MMVVIPATNHGIMCICGQKLSKELNPRGPPYLSLHPSESHSSIVRRNVDVINKSCPRITINSHVLLKLP